jgi:hypothetical protein
MSVESLEFWKNLFEIVGVVLLLLTFIAGAGVLWFSRKLNAVQAEQLKQFDKGLTDTKLELGRQQERAANAEHDAAEAKTTAATVNERTLALQKAAADAKAAQQKVEIELAKQQEKTASAERSLLQLQRRMEPRRISADQRARLVEILSNGPKGKVSIHCVLGDGEGQAFANDIDAVLKASGWDNPGVTQGAYSGGNPVGFGILVRNAITAPPYATALQKAFFSVGIPMPGVENSQLAEGIVEILVGNKPN